MCLYTFPSEFPNTELIIKSGGAKVSTRATASGLISAHSLKIPSLINVAGFGPDAYPPKKKI